MRTLILPLLVILAVCGHPHMYRATLLVQDAVNGVPLPKAEGTVYCSANSGSGTPTLHSDPIHASGEGIIHLGSLPRGFTTLVVVKHAGYRDSQVTIRQDGDLVSVHVVGRPIREQKPLPDGDLVVPLEREAGPRTK